MLGASTSDVENNLDRRRPPTPLVHPVNREWPPENVCRVFREPDVYELPRICPFPYLGCDDRQRVIGLAVFLVRKHLSARHQHVDGSDTFSLRSAGSLI